MSIPPNCGPATYLCDVVFADGCVVDPLPWVTGGALVIFVGAFVVVFFVDAFVVVFFVGVVVATNLTSFMNYYMCLIKVTLNKCKISLKATKY